MEPKLGTNRAVSRRSPEQFETAVTKLDNAREITQSKGKRRGDEDLFLERQWHSRSSQERHLSSLHGAASTGHPLLAGDQGRTRPGRDRFGRLRGVLEFGHQEGLFR